MSGLPAGFVIDGEQSGGLPEGFVLDSELESSQEQQPTFRSKAEAVFNRIRGASVGDVAKAGGELGLQAATGLGSTIFGGLAGLNAASSVDPIQGMENDDFETGRPSFQSRPDPIASIQGAQEAGTYQPKTELAQTVNAALSVPFEKYERMAYEGSSAAGDPDDVLGATAAYTSLMMLPAAIGMRGRRSKRGKDKKEAPSSETLKDEAQRLYTEADNSGAAVTSESYSQVLSRIGERLAEEGFDKNLHPKTWAAIRAMNEKIGNHQSLKGVEINRKILNEARATMEKSDARMAGRAMDIYDNWMDSLGKGDMLMGSPEAAKLYPQARQLWQRKMKSDEIEWAIERARERVSANYSNAAFSTALQQEFKNILLNKNKRRRFTDAELAAIRAVSRGDWTTQGMRLIGKLAPRGVISGAPGAAIMAANPVAGAGVWLLGEAAKRGADRLVSRKADQAAQTMRRGSP